MELSANKAPKFQNDEGVIEILDKLCYTIKDCLDFFYFNSAAVLHFFTPDENYGLQYNSGRNNESLLFFKINDRKDWIAEIELSLLHYKKSLKSKNIVEMRRTLLMKQ